MIRKRSEGWCRARVQPPEGGSSTVAGPPMSFLTTPLWLVVVRGTRPQCGERRTTSGEAHDGPV